MPLTSDFILTKYLEHSQEKPLLGAPDVIVGNSKNKQRQLRKKRDMDSWSA